MEQLKDDNIWFLRRGIMRHFIVFDIGGSIIKHGVISEKGTLLETNETITEAYLGGTEVIKKVKRIGNDLKDRYQISGICISTAGQVDSKKGEIIYASELIPQYTGMPIKKDLEQYFKLPVEVENDVNCVGLAESWIGKGKDVKSSFCLTLGTGIGGSFIADNTLHSGHSFSAGEIGYIPIEGEQFQDLASTKFLIKNVAYKMKINEEDINGKKIFEMAKIGNKICIDEINRLVYYLSKGIATIAYMMNPEMIIIGGGITKQKEYLYPLIKEQLKKDVIPAILKNTQVEIANNMNDAGMIGALRYFLLQESLQPFNKIITLIESNRHKLTKGESMIATYIINNITNVHNNTISEMADNINVSESMITRFCKKLDIGSYSKLRFMAKESAIGTRLHNKMETNALIEVKHDYVNVLNNLETLNESLDIQKLKDQVQDSKQLFLYGLDEISNAVELLKYKLMQQGISTDAFSNNYEIEMSTHILQSDAVVVGFSLSGYDKEIIKVMEHADYKGCLKIGVTSQQDSPLAKISDATLFLPSTGNPEDVASSISEVSILYLLEALFKEIKPLNIDMELKIEEGL